MRYSEHPLLRVAEHAGVIDFVAWIGTVLSTVTVRNSHGSFLATINTDPTMPPALWLNCPEPVFPGSQRDLMRAIRGYRGQYTACFTTPAGEWSRKRLLALGWCEVSGTDVVAFRLRGNNA